MIALLIASTAFGGYTRPTDTSGGGASVTIPNTYQWLGQLECGETLALGSDCFRDSSVDAAWEDYDVGTRSTLTESTDGLQVVNVAGTGISGIYRPITATGNYIITAHWSQAAALWDGSLGLYLCVAADTSAAPTTANHYCAIYTSATPTTFARTMNDYQTNGTIHDQLDVIGDLTQGWLRICVGDSTDGGGNDDLTIGVSTDGRDWHLSAVDSYATATVNPPVDMGIVLGGSAAATMHVDLFIVEEDEACNSPMGRMNDGT